VFVTSNKLF